MRKWIYRLAVALVAIYFGLHLALGSSPVQRRVVAEIRKALAGFGIDLAIESIEFSAFSPRIYLNRVTITTLPKAEIQLASPVPIDKIKIEFQPLALLTKRIVIEEVALFNPRLNLPAADKIYARVDRILSKRKPVQVKGDSFTLVIKKAGLVDAFFNLSVVNPPLAVRSRSLTAFVTMAVADQQNVVVSSNNIDFERGKLAAAFTQVDLDLDISKNAIRLNRAIVEGEGLSVNVKGTAGLPIEKNPSFNLSYDIKVPLAILNRIPELKAPNLKGTVTSAGTVRVNGGKYNGNGQLTYNDVNVNEYRIGKGGLTFRLSENKAEFTDLVLHYGGGTLSSKAMALELNSPYLLTGQLNFKEVWLHEVLDALDSKGALARLSLTGPMMVRGTLSKPFEIRGDLKATFPHFAVLNRGQTETRPDTTVIQLPGGEIDATLVFGTDKFSFQTNARVLDGKLFADGYVGYDNRTRVKVRAEGVNLTKLERVAAVALGGMADITSEVEVSEKNELKITSGFETKDASVQGLKLGELRGQAQYQDLLLSFENLESAGQLEPLTANGFVDFNSKATHYKFLAEVKRMTLKEAFHVFEKRPLEFRQAEGGELSARVSFEGGHDDEGVEVIASGQMRGFKWYGEDWLSSNFFVTYRPDESEVRRLVLLKKSGGIEVKGRFLAGKPAELSLTSHGLRVEELNALGRAPLSGEVVGAVRFTGPMADLRGNGELKLVRTSFRGKAFADSRVSLRSDAEVSDLDVQLLGETLRSKLTKKNHSHREWEALVSFEQFDFAPMASVLGGKDIPTVIDWLATGEITLKGDLTNWKTLTGGGSLSRVELGLQGTPMRNQEPVRLAFDKGAVQVSRFSLVGRDSQLGMEVFYDPEREVRASIDGKMDLQFLQPLLTGVEYGAGKVSLGLRISGRPGDTAWLGNVILEDGTFRITGLRDEFKNANAQLSLGQNKVNVERFEARVNGGTLIVGGDVGFGENWVPNLVMKANRVELRTKDYLATRLSGDLFLRGNKPPYLMGGTCKIHEARLTRFVNEVLREKEDSILKFDIKCDARDKLFVTTDVMNAEFKGDFHLLGTNDRVGLVGSAESVRGNVLFRERVFKITSAHVRFENPDEVVPRFSVAANTLVTSSAASASSLQAASQYDVNLQVFGTPKDYRIILTSTPELTEADIIALLLIGAPGRNQDGNLMDFGTTLMGQIPIQSKLQSELGFDIRIKSQPGSSSTSSGGVSQTASKASSTSDTSVPSVSIQKEITNRTKVSYSNTLEATPVREFKIEHMLDDNVTVNGIAVDRSRGTESVQTTQSYGLEIRYRHPFE